MILKASRIASIDHARKMAAHLTKSENEIVKVWESNGTSLENSLVQMQLLTKLTRGKRGIFHVAISPQEHETMTREQWEYSITAVEKELGFSGQPRSVIYHEKKGRPHIHVCWSMVDIDKGRILDPKQDRPRLQTLAQTLEKEFNHELTRRRANDNTIEITDRDRMREARTGKSAQERKEQFAEIWNHTTTGQEFVSRIQAAGYEFAQGDKARIVIVDRDGEVFNLVRQLPKLVRVKELRERLDDLALDLPSVKQVQERQNLAREREKAAEQEQTQEKTVQAPEKPLKQVKGLFTDQKDEITKEVERSPHDSGKKPRLSEAGESLSRLERRTKRKYSANTLVGLMSQYLNLSDTERQELHADLKAKLDADQEAFKRKAAQEKAAELNRKREDHERD